MAAPISLLQGTRAPAAAGTTEAGSHRARAGRSGRPSSRRSSARLTSTASGSAADRIMRALLPLSAAKVSTSPSQGSCSQPWTCKKQTPHSASVSARALRARPMTTTQTASTSTSK